jgi:hypothetical protein
MSDGSSKLIAIDEETEHEIVHGRRFGKTDRATHEPLDPHAQIDVLTFDLLGLGFANCVLLWSDMALVGAPPPMCKYPVGLGAKRVRTMRGNPTRRRW